MYSQLSSIHKGLRFHLQSEDVPCREDKKIMWHGNIRIDKPQIQTYFWIVPTLSLIQFIVYSGTMMLIKQEPMTYVHIFICTYTWDNNYPSHETYMFRVLAYFPSLRKESRLMRSPCCLSPHFNFWTIRLISTKLGMNVMQLDATPTS
jgi:hypothetical protein